MRVGEWRMPSAAQQKLQEIRPWISGVARVGFAARGTIYFLMGLLALAFAVGFTHEVEDMRGTIEKISQQAFGRAIALLLAFGFFNHGLWNAVQCGWDPERMGKNWVGQGARVVSGLSALLNFFFAYKIASVGFGRGWGGESGDEAVRSWTERVLAWPGGRALVLLAATIVAVVAVSLIVRLVRGKYLDAFSEKEVAGGGGVALRISAWLGFTARAMVAALVAWFLWRAGLHARPEEAGGFTKAFATLLQQPYGQWLVACAAVGLMAQGVYVGLMVPYREIRVAQEPEGMKTLWRRLADY